MKLLKKLQPLPNKARNPNDQLLCLQENLGVLAKCVGELANTVTRILKSNQNATNNDQQQSSQGEYLKQTKSYIETTQKKQTASTYQIQPRFTDVDVDLPYLGSVDDHEFEEQMLIWLGNVCRIVFSVGFNLLKNQQLTYNKMKAYCSENILRNILKLSHKHSLSPKHFQSLNKCLTKELLPYFDLKYPQSEQTDSSKKFSQMLIERNTLSENETDLIYKSGIKFNYEPEEDYNDQIMQFLNYVIKLPNQVPSLGRDGETEGKDSLFNLFYRDVQNIFKMVESEDNKISMLKFDPKNPSKQFDQQLKSQNKTEMFEQNKKGNREYAEKQRRQRQQEEYKQKVKSYTSYLIGSKLSSNFKTFSDYQIKTGSLHLRNSTIMRVVTKWCEQLQKYFDENQFLSRQTSFRMKDGSQNFLTKLQLNILNQMLQREKQNIKQKLKQIQSNNYEHQSKFSSKTTQNQLHKYSQNQCLVGQFTSAIFKINQNYLINYLNLLIKGINNAAESFGKYRDFQTYVSSQSTINDMFQSVAGSNFDRQALEEIQRYIGNVVLSAKKAYDKTPQLITFKIGDLMRCKCTSKQTQIMALYKQIQKISYQNPKLFKIIRVKNRLDQANKDILMNLLYRDTILVQMQLAIKSDKSKFIQCSNSFSHYLYQLRRAQFGPIAEMCSIWCSQDLRANFYLKKLNQSTKRNTINLKRGTDQSLCCLKIKNIKIVGIPFTCNICKCFYFSCFSSQKHIFCGKCKKNTCFLCQIQTFPEVMVKKILPQLTDNNKLNIQQIKFQKKVPQKGGGIIYLKSRNRKLLFFNVIDHKGDYYLFQGEPNQPLTAHMTANSLAMQLLKTGKRSLIHRSKGKNLSESFLKQNLIINIQQISNKVLPYTQSEANLNYFIPEYLLHHYKIQSKSVSLVKQQIDQFMFSQIIDGNRELREKVWVDVVRVNLAENKFSQLSTLPQLFPNAQSLILNGNKFHNLTSSSISSWHKIKQLYVSNNLIQDISSIVDNFPYLTLLDVSTNKISKLPINLPKLKHLQYLNIQENLITEINDEFVGMQKLRKLVLKNNRIKTISTVFWNLQCLVELDINKNCISTIPSSVGDMKSLMKLSIMINNNIQQLPQSFGSLVQLSNFQMGVTQIKTLPDSFGRLKKLTNFHCGTSALQSLPQSFGELQSLSQLLIGYTKIKNLPESFGNLKNLSVLFLRNTPLQKLPESFCNLKNLKQLRINNNNLQSLPQNFGQLESLKYLYMNDTQIKMLPGSFCKLRSLQYINMQNSPLQQLPQNIDNLLQLTHLNLSKTCLAKLPEQFTNIRALTCLHLSYSKLRQLPQKIGNLDSLNQLHIQGLQLIKLPSSFAHLQVLKVLNFKKNYTFDRDHVMAIVGKLDMLQEFAVYVQNLEAKQIPFDDLKSLKRLSLQYDFKVFPTSDCEINKVCKKRGIVLNYYKMNQ